MTGISISKLLDSILSRLPDFDLNAPAPDPVTDMNGFLGRYAALGWQLRRSDFSPHPVEIEMLRTAGLLSPEDLTAAELARAHLLRQGLESTPPPQRFAVLQELYRSGDNAERETVLKILILLPDPANFLDIALDACRSAVQTTVEAITLNNPYPARYFSAESYRNMVLKALHTGLPLARIDGLAMHLDDELSRMAMSYATERHAAGRGIPSDIILLCTRSSSLCA